MFFSLMTSALYFCTIMLLHFTNFCTIILLDTRSIPESGMCGGYWVVMVIGSIIIYSPIHSKMPHAAMDRRLTLRYIYNYHMKTIHWFVNSLKPIQKALSSFLFFRKPVVVENLERFRVALLVSTYNYRKFVVHFSGLDCLRSILGCRMFTKPLALKWDYMLPYSYMYFESSNCGCGSNFRNFT